MNKIKAIYCPEKQPHQLETYEWNWYNFKDDEYLCVCLPSGSLANLPVGKNGWRVEQHHPEHITLTPSILHRPNKNSGLKMWHGYLTDGYFVTCDDSERKPNVNI